MNWFMLKSSGSCHALITPGFLKPLSYSTSQHGSTLIQALRDVEGHRSSSRPESETVRPTRSLFYLTGHIDLLFSLQFLHIIHTANSSAEPGYHEARHLTAPAVTVEACTNE
ncbi:hypothetical protein AOLI_G00142020 [Acnodon oligacanthus]